jgi:hypothetical protein
VQAVARHDVGLAAEHVKVFDTKSLQVGFMLLQSAYGFIAFHDHMIENPGGCCHSRYGRFEFEAEIKRLEAALRRAAGLNFCRCRFGCGATPTRRAFGPPP